MGFSQKAEYYVANIEIDGDTYSCTKYTVLTYYSIVVTPISSTANIDR